MSSSYTLNIPFDLPSEVDHDTDEINISGGSAKLALVQADVDFTEDFADDTDFTYDTDKAEFTGGKVQQKLNDILGLNFTEDFADDTDFVYDSDKAEFSVGQVQQKDTRPAGALGYCSFTVDEEFDWQSGVGNNNLTGGAVVSEGVVDLTGASGKIFLMSGLCGFNSVGSAGCIRFVYIPNYTGNPVSTVQILEFDADVGNNGAIFIQQLGSSSTLAIDLRDSSGVTHQLYATGFNAVADQRFTFELNFDFDGTSRFFIDGIQKGNLNTSPWTRNPSTGTFRWGGAVGTGDCYLDDIVVFDSVQHTADHAGEVPFTYNTTIYVSSKVELPQMTYTGTGITEYIGASSTQSGTPKYIANDKYWNGASWVSSDGTYSQSNTISELNTNIGSLTPSGLNLNIDVVFTDLNTQSSVDNLQIDYTGNKYLETSVILPEMQHQGDGTIKLFNSLSVTYSGTPRILIEIGRSGDKLYWNGSAWAVSDESYTQSTDPITFNANCGTLDVDGEEYGQFTIVFQEFASQSSVSELTANMNVDIGYLTTNPHGKILQGFRTDELEEFVETAIKNGDDQVKYILENDGEYYYYDGSSWTTGSLTYSNSSTAAEIHANKSSLTLKDTIWYVHFFLHSDDGSTTPILSHLQITYSFEGTPETLEYCTVWWYMPDNVGDPSDYSVDVYLSVLSALYKTNTKVIRYHVTITPDTNGYCEVTLIENENMASGIGYIFDAHDNDIKRLFVPNEQDKNLYELEEL